ncbi:general substrate transporter [Wilcoxina mikolae CBS 423.85]|nr:general substrate transporter [Wilcoxina mikolae CBS 423.85]
MATEPYLLYTVTVIALGTFQFGYNMAELNEPRDAMTCPSTTVPSSQGLPECIPMASWEFGLVTSIFALGGLFGALAAQPMGNRYGRRSTLALNSTGFIVAAVMKALATNVNALVLGRFISGLSSGAAAVVVPLYVNEIAPPDAKGKFGAFTQISINIGILTTQVLGLFLSKPQYWRLILVVGAAIGALQGILLLRIPESPKYLVSVGNRNGARDSLARLRGPSYSAEIEDEIREEEPLTGTTEDPSKVSTFSFVTKREHRKSALIVCGLMLAQQLTGINACVLHGVSILQNLLPSAAGYINVIISAANLIITSLASMYFDKISHKFLLILSMLGMGTFAFLLAAGIANGIAVLSAVAFFCFVSSFSIGLGPLPWMVASKTVSYRAVDAAQSAGIVVNWMGTFAVAFLVPVLPTVWSFVGFGVIGWVSAAMVKWGVDAY